MKKDNLLSLKKTIINASQKYYEGKPIINDTQFDSLVDTLKQNNPTDPLLNTVGWGFDVAKIKGQKINHKYGLVGSLAKIHHMSEFNIATTERVVASSKLDGASCVAYFKNGKLQYAVTRGNGVIGLNKTCQFLEIIKKYTLNMGDFTGGIRGEIVISNKNWELYKGKYPGAKSPRNVATGLFMRDDVSADLQFVDFVTYKITGCENERLLKYIDVLNYLSAMGFETVEFREIDTHTTTDAHMQQIFNGWFKYPMDGIVLQTNITQQTDGTLLYNDIAYKFQAEIKETTVLSVDWNLSKNNIMVPVININPIELSGATVSKTSGFNYKYIKTNKIGVGSVVKMCRSGEVIPYIIEVIGNAQHTSIPTTCPICGEPLSNDDTELFCANTHCPNIEKSRVFTWLQVIGVRDLLGVGDSILDTFYQLLTTVCNKPNFTVEDLYGSDGPVRNPHIAKRILDSFTPAASMKIKSIIENLSKPTEFYNIVYACNIKGLGILLCQKLEPILYEWFTTKNSDILNTIHTLPGVGLHVENIIKNNLTVFDRLLGLVTRKSETYPPRSKPDVKITITGSLSIPRKQFEQLCTTKNIAVDDNIRTSDYLVTNDCTSGSSKLQKAEKYGIPIITEQKFREMFGI